MSAQLKASAKCWLCWVACRAVSKTLALLGGLQSGEQRGGRAADGRPHDGEHQRAVPPHHRGPPLQLAGEPAVDGRQGGHRGRARFSPGGRRRRLHAVPRPHGQSPGSLPCQHRHLFYSRICPSLCVCVCVCVRACVCGRSSVRVLTGERGVCPLLPARPGTVLSFLFFFSFLIFLTRI